MDTPSRKLQSDESPDAHSGRAQELDPLFVELDELTNGECQAWRDDESQQDEGQ
jgi:hypothetical protein